MNVKKLVITLIVGALMLSAIGVVAAQGPANRAGDGGLFQHPDVMDIISEATGLSVAEIVEQLRDGATLAEIIEANGGDVEAVIDQVVEAAMINEDVLRERITERINQQFGPGFGPARLRMGLHMVADALTELGFDPLTVTEQLRDGETLAAILEDAGHTVDEFVALAMENVSAALAERVDEGYLTQEEADALLAAAEERLTAFIDGEYGTLLRDRLHDWDRDQDRLRDWDRDQDQDRLRDQDQDRSKQRDFSGRQ